MAGKKRYSKKGGGHQNHSSSNNYAPKLSEQQIQDLVIQATQIHTLLNQRHQKLKQMKDFAYILSTKWLREWKDYVGFQALFSDDKQGNKKQGKKRPGPPNSDLTITSNQYLQIPQELEQYQYLNTIINSKLQMNDDFISVTQQLWNKFNSIYGPGTEIKRPLRITKSKTAYVDGSLHYCDFIFINYGQQDFINKLESCKINKAAIQQLIPYYTVQFSAIWELDQLYELLQKICLVKYNNQKVTLWLCQNFLGVASMQQNFIKSAKAKTYEMYATKLQQQDYENLDLQDFIKKSYMILVQVGDSKVVPVDVPDDLFGYCQQCIQKKNLQYHCKCEHKHYCSRQCQIDDQVYHFNSCKYAFTSVTDQEYDQKKVTGVSNTSKCGLKNLGNTCYMNSSIQTFLGLDFLVDFLTQNKYKECISKSQKHCDIFLQHVSKTCKMMGQEWDKGYIEPWDLKGQVNYFLTPFKGYKQHDAIDFFMGFINTINDCLAKPNQQQAYHPLIKNNLLGEFDSLVICPDCDNQVKNIQCFTQLTLPIKAKTAKMLYNYVLFDNHLSFKHGKAQVKQTWQQIKSNIGVPDDCIMYAGQENQTGLTRLDQSASPQTVLKKFKKQLLFYPHQKLKHNQFIFDANFIHMKSFSGQNLKANNGYPFPVVVTNEKTMGHFFIDLLRKINFDKNLQIIQQIEIKYEQVDQKRKQLKKQLEEMQEASTQVSQTTQNKQSKQQSNKQPKKQQKSQKTSNTKNKSADKQQKQQKKQIQQKSESVKQEIEQQLEQLNNQLKNIMQQLNIKVFIQDTNKQRNVCFFCKRRCAGCLLEPDFRVDVQDLLGLKKDEARLFIHLTPKPEPTRVRQDLASCGDTSLKDCLQLFGQPQTLDEQNAWYCPQCDDMRLAFKQLHISKYPKYMIIQLSRFKNGANGKVKNNEPITYNQYQILGDIKYRLLSVIIHEGSIEGGHYWAICRRGEQYYIFNDQKVVKTDKISNKNAYILCYKQVQEAEKKQINNSQ